MFEGTHFEKNILLRLNAVGSWARLERIKSLWKTERVGGEIIRKKTLT